MSEHPCIHLIIRRDAHLFAARPGLMERMKQQRALVLLTADQMLHATEAGDFIVRRGKLRVSEFMADGREVTRAVLQAGAVMLTRESEMPAADPEDDRYLIADLVLMALGEVELWVLPTGALEQSE